MVRRVSVSPCNRYLLLIWACLECLILGGLAMGWYSLVYVLQKEKFFLDYCDGSDAFNDTLIRKHPYNFTYDLYSKDTQSRYDVAVDGTDYNIPDGSLLNASSTVSIDDRCVKQDEMFSLVFTVATSILTLLAPVFGHIQYKLGTRVARIVMIIIYLTGTLTLAFMTVDTPWLNFIGLTFMATGGLPILTTNSQIANLFPTGASSVVCLLSGSYDASTSMQILIKIGFENGLSRKTSYLLVSGLTSMLVISTFFFLPKGFIEKRQEEASASVVLTLHIRTDDDNEAREDIKVNNNRDEDLEIKRKHVMTSSAIPSLKQCLLSRMFITQTIWLTLLQLRFLYYLGTLNPRINSLANHNVEADMDRQLYTDVRDGTVSNEWAISPSLSRTVSYYTNMCLYIQFGGVITALLTGMLMDCEKKRFSKRASAVERQLLPMVLPLILASVLALLLSGVSMATTEAILIPSFVLLTAFRSVMFGVALGFVQYVFPIQYMALMYGVMFVVSGIFNTLQYPLFIWNEQPPRGYAKVEGFLMVLIVLTLIHPAYLWWASRRAGKGHHTQETDIIEAGSSELAQPLNASHDRESDRVL